MVVELIDSLLDEARTIEADLLVVDDSPTPERHWLTAACSERGVRHLPGPRLAAAKRTIGAEQARSELVLFIDSDCIATPGLLREYVRAFSSAPPDVGAMIGPTDMAGTPAAWPWPVVERSRMYNQCYGFARDYEQVLWGTTSNICVRRQALLKVGGFDDGGPVAAGGEDVDFGIRLNAAGFRILTRPQAVVHHRREHITSVRQVAASLFGYGRADVHLCAQHPERRGAYLNPVAVAGGAFLMAMLGDRRARSVGVVLASAAVTVVARTRCAASANPYRSATEDTARPRIFDPLDLGATVLDLAFDGGVLLEALRRRRPMLAVSRFDYVDPHSFVPVEPPRHDRGKARAGEQP